MDRLKIQPYVHPYSTLFLFFPLLSFFLSRENDLCSIFCRFLVENLPLQAWVITCFDSLILESARSSWLAWRRVRHRCEKPGTVRLMLVILHHWISGRSALCRNWTSGFTQWTELAGLHRSLRKWRVWWWSDGQRVSLYFVQWRNRHWEKLSLWGRREKLQVGPEDVQAKYANINTKNKKIHFVRKLLKFYRVLCNLVQIIRSVFFWIFSYEWKIVWC